MGKSRRSNVFSTGIDLMMADTPRMTRILNTLLPMILPTLISELPLSTLMKLTMNSGRLVPSATTVRPMTSSLTFRRLARPLAPSVKRSAPQSTTAMLTTIRTISSIILFYI